MVLIPMPFIRVDGVLYDYADYEDNVKPAWKKKMRELDEKENKD